MALSTSIFKSRWRRVFLLLVVLGLGVATSIFYQGRVSPEVSFWRKAVASKFQYLETLDPETPKVVFVGGSSCSFSINVELLHDEYQIQSLNCGLLAGAGRDLQLDLGLTTLNKGDVLVLAFETHDWGNNDVSFQTPMGSQLWFTAVEPYAKKSSLAKIGREPHYQWRDLRIGGMHATTMGLKAALGRSLYRYSPDDIQPGGYLTTSYRDAAFGPHSRFSETTLSAQMKEFLLETRSELAERDIHLVVTFPWYFMTPEVASKQREEWRQLAEEMAVYVTVLKDPNWGVSTDEEDFADTAWHLSKEGALARTSVVGKELQSFLVGLN